MHYESFYTICNPQQLLCTYAACTNILYCRDYHRLHFGPIGNFGWCQRQIHRRRITLGDHLVAGAADCFRSLLFARHFRIVRRGLKFSARGLTCFWMWNRRVEVKVKAHASFAYLLLSETNLRDHWLSALVKIVKTVHGEKKHFTRQPFRGTN